MSNDYIHAFETMLAQCNQISSKYFSHVSSKKIVNFSYNELSANGDFFVLNNNEPFLQMLIENDICLEMPKSILKAHPYAGFYLLDLDNQTTREVYKPYMVACEKFGMAHTLRFVKVDSEPDRGLVIKRFGLEASYDNTEANYFYMNNLPVISKFFNEMDNFIKRIKTNVRLLPSEIAPNKIRQYISHIQKPQELIININEEQENNASQQSNDLLSDVYLTNRELEVLEWLQKGKTAEETAIILGRSRRTIESHFAKLRQKFKCSSKYQVLKHAKLLQK